MTKLHTDKGINKGVKAAPQEGHTLSDISGIHENVIIVAVLKYPLSCDHSAPKQDQVVRHLADQEDSHHSKNHFDSFIPFKVASLAKGLDNAAVTKAHDQEWNGKSHDNLACLDADTERVRTAGIRGAGVVIDGGVNHFGNGEEQCHHPNDCR